MHYQIQRVITNQASWGTACKHIHLEGEKRNKYWMWHTRTQRLPGLCHGAAVTAAALRAPAQPQLLLRLAPMKVVCEFSKTRHLRSHSLRSPPLTFTSLPSDPLRKERNVRWVASSSSAELDLLALASAFYLDSVSAAGPSLLSHSLIPSFLCRGTRRNPALGFSPHLPAFDRCLRCTQNTHTRRRTHWRSQNSNDRNCLPNNTATEESKAGRRENGGEVSAERRSSSVRENAELVGEYELQWCSYPRPPPTPPHPSASTPHRHVSAYSVCAAHPLSLSSTLMHEFFHMSVWQHTQTHTHTQAIQAGAGGNSDGCEHLSVRSFIHTEWDSTWSKQRCTD